MRALIEACGRRSPTGKRNRALIVVLWRAGLRISEALSLQVNDVGDGWLRVERGKGGKARTVGMDPEAFAVLERWMDERRRQRRQGRPLTARAPLFCTLKGGWMDDAYVRRLLRRLAKKAGVQKRVHPHGLRHTHANELAEEGVAMPIIQAQLGHSSLETTARYLKRVSSTPSVVSTMSSRAWSGSSDEGSSEPAS